MNDAVSNNDLNKYRRGYKNDRFLFQMIIINIFIACIFAVRVILYFDIKFAQ